jgi:alpha-ketoglutarate-dependent taurine dioxygenase
MQRLDTVQDGKSLLSAVENCGSATAFLGTDEIAERLRNFVAPIGIPVKHKHSAEVTQLVDIRSGSAAYDETARPQNTPTRQSAHTDGASLSAPPHLVSLCGVRSAAIGGDTVLVSGAEILSEALEVLDVEQMAVLFDADSYTVHRGSKSLMRPVLAPSADGGSLMISFGTHEFNSVEVKPEARTPFELLRVLRSRPEFQRRFVLEPGMAVFIANSAVLHGREPWFDSDSAYRHVIRLWVSGAPDSPLERANGIPVAGSDRLVQLLHTGIERLGIARKVS